MKTIAIMGNVRKKFLALVGSYSSGGDMKKSSPASVEVIVTAG